MLMKRDLSLKGSEAKCLIDASWAVRTQSTDGRGGRVKGPVSAVIIFYLHQRTAVMLMLGGAAFLQFLLT